MIKKYSKVLLCCVFIVFCYCGKFAFSQETRDTKAGKKNTNVIKDTQAEQQTNKEKQKSGKVLQFIKKYIITDEDPAFGNARNAFLGGVYGAMRSDERNVFAHPSRGVYTATLHYAQPIKFFRVHARLSAGFFTIQGAGQEFKQKYRMYGMEIFPEIIFGNKILYLTGGLGLSYIFTDNAKYRWYDANGSHLTPFNWSSTVGIGHRFDFGMILEFHIKHYSNGGLGKVNKGFTSFGVVVGYAF